MWEWCDRIETILRAHEPLKVFTEPTEWSNWRAFSNMLWGFVPLALSLSNKSSTQQDTAEVYWVRNYSDSKPIMSFPTCLQRKNFFLSRASKGAYEVVQYISWLYVSLTLYAIGNTKAMSLIHMESTAWIYVYRFMCMILFFTKQPMWRLNWTHCDR